MATARPRALPLQSCSSPHQACKLQFRCGELSRSQEYYWSRPYESCELRRAAPRVLTTREQAELAACKTLAKVRLG